MNNSNITHQMYQTLVTTNNVLLEALRQTAAQCSVEEAQENLSALLQTNVLFPGEQLDYPRFYRLLKKDLSELELSNEDFSGMTLDKFNFAGATLNEANFMGASLREADFSDCYLSSACFAKAQCSGVKAKGAFLCEASLASADWSDADCRNAAMKHMNAIAANFNSAKFDHADLYGAALQRANFSYASLSSCNLEGVSLEGANLSGCSCTTAYFGRTLRFDADTEIDSGNHTLISMVLVTRAQTVEQRKFALYIRYQTGLCWPGFTRLLVRQRELAPWVEETMGTVLSLKAEMEEFKGRFQRLLDGDKGQLSLDDIHPSLDLLVKSVIKQHALLPRPDLYWYLQGVLEMAYRQPGMDLNEEQKRIVLERLQAFTNIPSE